MSCRDNTAAAEGSKSSFNGSHLAPPIARGLSVPSSFWKAYDWSNAYIEVSMPQGFPNSHSDFLKLVLFNRCWAQRRIFWKSWQGSRFEVAQILLQWFRPQVEFKLKYHQHPSTTPSANQCASWLLENSALPKPCVTSVSPTQKAIQHFEIEVSSCLTNC